MRQASDYLDYVIPPVTYGYFIGLCTGRPLRDELLEPLVGDDRSLEQANTEIIRQRKRLETSRLVSLAFFLTTIIGVVVASTSGSWNSQDCSSDPCPDVPPTPTDLVSCNGSTVAMLISQNGSGLYGDHYSDLLTGGNGDVDISDWLGGDYAPGDETCSVLAMTPADMADYCGFPPPTPMPSQSPAPTSTPTILPTNTSGNITVIPTMSPSFSPTMLPTNSSGNVTVTPTMSPSFSPTMLPTNSSGNVTVTPTMSPSFSPTMLPTNSSGNVTVTPTMSPSPAPTGTSAPSFSPTMPVGYGATFVQPSNTCALGGACEVVVGDGLFATAPNAEDVLTGCLTIQDGVAGIALYDYEGCYTGTISDINSHLASALGTFYPVTDTVDMQFVVTKGGTDELTYLYTLGLTASNSYMQAEKLVLQRYERKLASIELPGEEEYDESLNQQQRAVLDRFNQVARVMKFTEQELQQASNEGVFESDAYVHHMRFHGFQVEAGSYDQYIALEHFRVAEAHTDQIKGFIWNQMREMVPALRHNLRQESFPVLGMSGWQADDSQEQRELMTALLDKQLANSADLLDEDGFLDYVAGYKVDIRHAPNETKLFMAQNYPAYKDLFDHGSTLMNPAFAGYVKAQQLQLCMDSCLMKAVQGFESSWSAYAMDKVSYLASYVITPEKDVEYSHDDILSSIKSLREGSDPLSYMATPSSEEGYAAWGKRALFGQPQLPKVEEEHDDRLVLEA